MSKVLTYEDIEESGWESTSEPLSQRWRDFTISRFEIVRSAVSAISEPTEQTTSSLGVLADTEYYATDLDGLKAAADALEASLFADDGYMVDSQEAEALRALGSHRAFAALALSADYPPDVRGIAARLFAEYASKEVTGDTDTLLTALAENAQPLVRLGLVYGLEETTNHELLRQFVEDPHPRVRLEAQRIQDHA